VLGIRLNIGVDSKLNFLTYTPDVSKEFNGQKPGDVATINELSRTLPSYQGDKRNLV
jgi:hypothetical protein